MWEKVTKGLLYFIFLITITEYLDYSFLELSNTDYGVGKICFWLFFVILPILLLFYYSTAPAVSKSEKEDASVNADCEKNSDTSKK
jgi:hypothetical protein